MYGEENGDFFYVLKGSPRFSGLLVDENVFTFLHFNDADAH